MRERWYAKSKKNKYDPQIGEAARAQAALAERTETWNQDYFTKYVQPAMEQLTTESKVNLDRQGKLFDLNYDQAKLQDERYRTLGIPAEDAYVKKLGEYSGEEFKERKAREALGDLSVAAAGEEEATNRRFQGLGVDPTSRAALSARSDIAFKNAAVRAGASTRARDAAEAMGIANLGEINNVRKGSFANTQQAGGSASGNANSAAGIATNAAGAAPGGAANVNQGFSVSNAARGNVLDSYTSLGKTSMETAGPSALASIAKLGVQAFSAYKGSDRRIKKDIKKVATLAHGIGLWMYRYIWEPDTVPLQVGYMADEVEPVFPDAVRTGPGGYKQVNYSKVMV